MKKHLIEGGAGGHMAHPFDLSSTRTGSDLLTFFEKAKEILESSGGVKIDGVNLSIKVVGEGDNKQFAIDRGSTMSIDLNGVTVDKLRDRFPPKIDKETGKKKEHGMVSAGTLMLNMFNDALPSIKKELITLGLYDDPTKFLNTEFVEKKTNVQEYDDNFLAIHGVNQFYEKTNSRTGASRPGLERPLDDDGKPIKSPSVEVNYTKNIKSALESLAKKVYKISDKYDFKVYTRIPVFQKEGANISFDNSLNSKLSIRMFSDEEPKTQTLKQWLTDSKNPPKEEQIIFLDKRKNETRNKEVYVKALNGEPLDGFLLPEKDNLFKAVDGIVSYHATRLLGQDILSGLTSEMGDMTKHEGIVLRDEELANVPVKITGDFILGGMQTSFPRENMNEEIDSAEFTWKRKVAVYPGGFKPPHVGHLYMIEQSIIQNGADEVIVLVAPGEGKGFREIEDGKDIDGEKAKKILDLYISKKGLQDRVKVILKGGSPVRITFDIVDGNLTEFKPEEGDLIIPVASDKLDDKGIPDWHRFKDFEHYRNELDNVYPAPMEDFVIPALGEFSASQFRNAIANGESIEKFIPNEVTEQEVLNIIGSPITSKEEAINWWSNISDEEKEDLVDKLSIRLKKGDVDKDEWIKIQRYHNKNIRNDQMQESAYAMIYSLVEEALLEDFQSDVAKPRLRKAYNRLTKTGRKDLVKYGKPFTEQPNYTKSNAFLAKEEQELEEISAMGLPGGGSVELGTGNAFVGKRDSKKKTKKKTTYKTKRKK